MRFPHFAIALSQLAAVSAVAQLPEITDFSLMDPSPLPFGGAPTLRWDVTGATRVALSPGAGTVGAAGTSTLSPAGGVVLAGAGAVWRYLDTGDDLGPSDQASTPAAWFHPGYDDSGWGVGVAPLGYTNDNSASATPTDQSADLRYGGVPTDDPAHPNKLNDPAAKFPTYYFRRTFEIPAALRAECRALAVSVRRDDSVIGYLNGVEILRHNLPSGTVTRDTLATGTAVGGNEFGTFFRVEVPVARLYAGANTLAFEVHQANATSSDIVLDAQVEAVLSPGLVTLLPRGSEWRYLDDGSDAGVAWRASGFNDTAWSKGDGVLGYNNSVNNAAGTSAGANTLAEFGPDPNAKPIVTWFRKSFEANDVANLIDFTLSANFDDGMIVYLNGLEIARAFMPDGEVTASTLAITHEGDYSLPPLVTGTDVVVADAGTIAAALVNGTNQLAVQLHQSAANSSDASFNLGFTATDGAVTHTLVKPFDDWAFLDTGEDLGTHSSPGLNSNPWVALGFDDSAWKRGLAEIGYGDPNDNRAPVTALDYGPELATKTVTAYFRRTVNIPNPGSFPGFTLEVFRDDAAAVYVNGVELYRDANLPIDAAFDTLATATSNATASFVVPSSVFQAGTNTLAVEVHQGTLDSSDLLFDLALYGMQSSPNRTYTLTASNASGTTTRELVVPFAEPPASPVLLTTSMAGGVSAEPGWNSAAVWRDQLVPDAGKAYAVNGALSRVLATGDATAHRTFSGGSLTLGPGSVLVHNGSSGTSATCAALVLNGGEVQSAHNGAAGELQVRTLAGAISVTAPSTINPGGANRALNISARLTGNAPLTVAGNAAGDAPNVASSVRISGQNAAYTGDWEVFSQDFATGSAAALGGTTADPNVLRLHSGAVLRPIVALAAPNTDVLVNNSGGANPGLITLSRNIQVRTLTLVDTPVDPGTYTFATLTPEQQAYFIDGTGILTVTGASADDTDGDGLPDAWESANLGTLTYSGADDPDADGFTNTAEFKIGTHPANGASFYRFSGPTVVTVAGAPAVRLEIPAQAAWTVQPQWSPSLQNGQWQNLGPALTGSMNYIVDDTGATTGGVPPLSPGARRRFYRVQLNVP